MMVAVMQLGDVSWLSQHANHGHGYDKDDDHWTC